MKLELLEPDEIKELQEYVDSFNMSRKELYEGCVNILVNALRELGIRVNMTVVEHIGTNTLGVLKIEHDTYVSEIPVPHISFYPLKKDGNASKKRYSFLGYSIPHSIRWDNFPSNESIKDQINEIYRKFSESEVEPSI